MQTALKDLQVGFIYELGEVKKASCFGRNAYCSEYFPAKNVTLSVQPFLGSLYYLLDLPSYVPLRIPASSMRGDTTIKVLSSRKDLSARFGAVSGGNVVQTGWDPEIFVTSDDKLLPAFKFLPSKDAPFHVHPNKQNPDYGVPQLAYWDGYQAEFTTEPYHCHGWAIDSLQRGIEAVFQQARKFDKKAKLTLQNVFELTPDELFTATADQVALGCEPSFNAYGTDPFLVDNPFDLPYRMAGGHIHFGLSPKKLTREKADAHVKKLDLLVALPAVGMFSEIDNPLRRQFYGRAGEYRLPPHGLEYRTLSNAWMGHSAVVNLLMDTARVAMGPWTNSIDLKDLDLSEEYVRDVIDNTDVKAARAVFERNQFLWEAILKYCYGSRGTIKGFNKMVQEGVESYIPSYRDLETNWCLKPKSTWGGHSNRANNGDWSGYTSSHPL